MLLQGSLSSEIGCHLLRSPDVRLLRTLVAAAQQDDEDEAPPGEVHAISRAMVDAKLRDAFADGLHVAQQTGLNPDDALGNLRGGPLVPERLEPPGEFPNLANSPVWRIPQSGAP